MSTPQIRRHLTANAHLKKRHVLLLNFLGGLAWGLGSVVGAGVVLAMIVWILKMLGVFEALSTFFPQTYR